MHFKREYNRWFVQEVDKDGFQAIRFGIGDEEDERGEIFDTPEQAWRDAHWTWAAPTGMEEG